MTKMFPSSYSLSLKPPPPKYSDFKGYGWIIVICSFILYLIVDGIAYNLGLINSAWLAEFEQSETATSWIGSIFYSVPLLSAPITAKLVEKFGCKTITIVCSIISTFGFVMSSFCGSIEQLYMTVGLIAGFGVSAGYVVGILSAERWFEKNRTLAIGIVSSGTGFGTFLIAPITQRLLDAYGWRNVMFFLASLNVLMGVVGFFIREPQWVIDEMEKKGIKVTKKNENHGIFEEHETSFGTFRRVSIETIEDLKDVVRGHFHDNYSHLEEVVEENGLSNEKSEVMLENSEMVPDGEIGYSKSEVMTPKCSESEVMCQKSTKSEDEVPLIDKNEVRFSKSNKSEAMSSESHKNEVMYPLSQKCEVMSSQYDENEINSSKLNQTNITSETSQEELEKFEVMSHHTTPSITTMQQAQSRNNKENIEQQIIVNDSQDRSNLENNINNIETETNTSFSANANRTNSHVSHIETENEKMSEHLPQTDEEYYQEEFFGSDGDCEALTPINDAKNIRIIAGNCDECQCMSKNDVRSKFESGGTQNGSDGDQVFTISGQNLQNYPENLKICHHNLKNRHSNPNLSIGNLKHPNNITKSFDNLHYSKPDPIQPPSYTQACYVFQNADQNHTNSSQRPSKKQNMTAVIFEFLKAKFKLIKKLFSHFSNRDFTMLAASTFVIYSLYNIPIYFIVELLKNYGYTEAQCANYISLIGISILIGMITLGYVGDVSGIHVKNVNAFCVLICGIAEILLPNFATNSVAFGICCFFFGFSFASAYVLIPKIAEMIVGVEKFASAIGLNFFVQGLALLFGIPFASTIYETIGR